MARAGLTLIALVSWSLIIGYVASAPIPGRVSYSLTRREAQGCLTTKLFDRSSTILPEFENREPDDAGSWHAKVQSRSSDYSDSWQNMREELAHTSSYKSANKLEKRSLFSKLKHKLKHAFNKIKKGVQTIKKATKVVGKGLKKAAHYVKQNAAKFGKLGLKIAAAAASAAGRVAKFIPGVGTAISMGLKGFAMGANIASDEIHANLGGVLGKVAGGLDYVINPMGTASKRLGGAGIAAGLLGREY